MKDGFFIKIETLHVADNYNLENVSTAVLSCSLPIFRSGSSNPTSGSIGGANCSHKVSLKSFPATIATFIPGSMSG